MSSRLKVSLALLVGFVGLAIAGANLPVDTQLTIRTKLGKRTQPHWLVPTDSKIVRTEGGSGLFRLVGGLLGCAGFATTMHLAGEDERQQRLFWDKQIVADGIQLKEDEVSAEINAGVRLKKLQMDAQADVDLYSLQLQRKFREAIGFVPELVQPALPHGKPGTLDEITNPSDKVEDSTTSAIEPNKYTYINGFISSTCLCWGNQGGGKSWFVRYLVCEKLRLGYRVIAFDPNSNQAAWEGVELYNSYAEIEKMMRWYVNEVQERYESFCASTITEEEWRKKLWEQGRAISIICEEATTYADFIKDEELLAKFFRCGGTLSRKPEMPLTIVVHNNTQFCLGNVKGLGNLIRRMQQIQLIATTDKSSKISQPVASGKALIKMDGSEKWVEVQVPKIESKVIDFRGFRAQKKQPTFISENPPETVGNVPVQEGGEPGTLYGTKAERILGILAEILAGTPEIAVFHSDSPLEQDEKLELAKLIIAEDLGTEKTIWLLWGIRRGGRNHALYTEARAMLERLVEDNNTM